MQCATARGAMGMGGEGSNAVRGAAAKWCEVGCSCEVGCAELQRAMGGEGCSAKWGITLRRG